MVHDQEAFLEPPEGASRRSRSRRPPAAGIRAGETGTANGGWLCDAHQNDIQRSDAGGDAQDNPSARDFYSMLPLDLTVDDFASSEKIAYLPRKLTDDGKARFGNERPYDICYYAPWGNLALFFVDYSYSRDLIRLGRFETGQDALHVPGKFPLRIEAL
ncbi:major facilitator superfamily protein [Bradyrhizobium lupini HPC(L)]|uniref:Major facilitator superfamily protein n=1 Tax=Bradyrhizobium lupini HPC(L) TaxID=1229491 RepID=A0ABN0HK29_RHILU|nr:major facilitator superfamily protein [Bradyrhizobium lupini HPC(L)]